MRNTWLWTGLGLAFLAGGSYGLYVILQPRPLPQAVLYGNGHVEGTEIRVAAEVAGRIVVNHLVEGEPVEKGALLVKLDDRDFILRRERAEAEIEALRRNRERSERELDVARHHLESAERDLARYRELRARETIPPQRLDQAQDAFEEARGHVAVLEAEIAAFEARIEAAEKESELAASALAKTRVLSPTEGTILAKVVEAGEYVLSGQSVAVIVDLEPMELRVFIPERDIGKVWLGAPAEVRVDAFPDRLFKGRVARTDQQAQFTPRDIHMPEERVRMVFGVTLEVANPDHLLKPGMPADAWILWQRGSTWPERLFVPE